MRAGALSRMAMHKSRLSTIVIDCQVDDVDAAATFWSNALGRPIEPPQPDAPAYRELAMKAGEPIVLVQKVTHPSRVHLDIESDDVDAEVERLEALGARRWKKVKSWWVLDAPTGQKLCVVKPQRGPLEDDERANTWEGGASTLGGEPGTQSDLISMAKRYVAAAFGGATGEALASFFDPSVTQEELPNRLVPTGAKRDLAGLLEAAARGQGSVKDQRFEVISAVATGDTVALEGTWSATVDAPLGSLPAGGTLRAHIATFIQFRDGKIVSQRSYDCFEPF